MNELSYPFDSTYLMKNKKKIRRKLKEIPVQRIKKKIAVLGGSTTNDIVSMLDLFLLKQGIECEFYQSEYGKYWEDIIFENTELKYFDPDLIYIHTTTRNITEYSLDMTYSNKEIEESVLSQFEHFREMWEKISLDYGCPVIQNNFEMPHYRMLGNRDSWDYHGKINFISKLNNMFYDYASKHENFYVNDINYISACCGLDKWHDLFYWYMYKYAMNICFIPDLAFNIANIIKSVFGKNKKALALDLDNTLWGGVIGDDGIDGIEIGKETAQGEAYYEFQQYIKEQKKIGVILGVCSKNDFENAKAGLELNDCPLSPNDFVNIKANWEPKDVNIAKMADEIGILPESIVFADDNPAEREIVSRQLDIETPPFDRPENYIRLIDKNGFFEVTSFSNDDVNRNEMYIANSKRAEAVRNFKSYDDYLESLEMTAEIESFKSLDFQRITQLTNKSNQFNLTTRRYTQSEIEEISYSNEFITLCGRLTDKFGDNGVVSVVIGKKDGIKLHIDLWLMSCRVLKRDMEYAMLDSLVENAKEQNIEEIYGYYYKTKKNNMVRDLFSDFGFEKVSEDSNENTVWKLVISEYKNKNKFIKIKEIENEQRIFALQT